MIASFVSCCIQLDPAVDLRDHTGCMSHQQIQNVLQNISGDNTQTQRDPCVFVWFPLITDQSSGQS